MPSVHDQVLEFGLGSERYCTEIAHVSEIVGREELTSLPNAPSHVLGAMDTRGETLTVLDPKVVFGVEGEPTGSRVVVLDSEIGDDEHLAWLVDSVHEVTSVTDAEVDESIENESEGVRGALRREDRVVVWVDPRAVGRDA